MRQGRCVLPTDEQGRVCDRLAGLEEVIDPETIRQVLEETGRVNPRRCTLTHEVVLWVVLAMGLFTDVPIRQVFKRTRFARADEESPGRSSLSHARQRLGVAPVRRLFQRTVRPLATPETPGAFDKGMHLMGIDGVVLNLPDRPANEAVFGRPSGGDRGAGAFPQLRKVSLVELGTHAEVAFVAKPITTGEQAALPTLLDRVPEDALLLLDRGFFSYELWNQLVSRQIRVLARVKKNLILRPIQTPGDGSYLAKIDPKAYDREKDRGGIVVRVIRYKLDDPQRVGDDEEHVLITNLWDEELYPAGELIPLYHQRWEEELTFDEQKTHQDPRRAGKPAHLRSETPAGVIQELYALSLAHFVVRALMCEAAGQDDVDPDRLSFTGCFQILKCRLPECRAMSPESFSEWSEALLREMARERVEPRNRVYGRRTLKAARALFALIHRRDERDPERFAGELEDAANELEGQVKFGMPRTPDAENLADRFWEHGPNYLRFLTTPGIEPTNNLAEQAIRFVVIDRHVTQGSRSEAGQRWLERIWTALATCMQQGRSLFEFLNDSVSAHFRGLPPPSLLDAPS